MRDPTRAAAQLRVSTASAPPAPPCLPSPRRAAVQVAAALGQELAMPAAANMMRYIAELVLGWASGAGRQRAELTAREFAAVVDHFRVE